ncbi:MAG: calcium/sodium antiporter [Kiritimatiellae bacterium]|nr:calcium/sodium antiporter [Kiritimatiellia bacterium]
MMLLLAGLAIGIAFLVWSADLFVGNSASLARRLGLPPLLVGMFVIGFGTSLPEMMVSLISALEGNPSIALGNAYGSNIANIWLILGVTALLSPITVADTVRRRDLPVLFFVTALAGVLLANGVISRLDALLMLVAFVAVCIWNMTHGAVMPEADDKGVKQAPLWKMLLGVVAGLVIVVASSRLLVVSAVGLAKAVGVPDLVVGLTVVAIGTSLPELASSIAAISRQEHDMALGNVIGSNLFNTLFVVGIAGVTRPIDGEGGALVIKDVLHRDYPTMALATFLLAVACRKPRGRAARIDRWEGGLFLVLYIAYVALLAKEALAR